MLVKRLVKKLPGVLVRQASTPRRVRQQQRRLGPEQVTKLVAEYRTGTALTVLATRHGVHPHTVASLLRGAGVELRSKGLLDVQIDEAARLYAQGWSLSRIGNRLDYDAKTVWRQLRARGVIMRKPWESRN